MIYYIILDLLLILLTTVFRPYKASTNNNKAVYVNRSHFYVSTEMIYTLFVALMLTFFMGARGNITADYNSYAMLFKKNAAQSFGEVIADNDYTELGFRLLNKLISMISIDVDFYMTVIACIFVFMIVYEGRREVTNIALFVLLFVNCGSYLLSFNMMRQGLAAAITYSATKYLRKNKMAMYIVMVGLATTIHTSALIMIPCYFLLNREITRKNVTQLITAGVIAFFSLTSIIGFVQKFRYSGYTYNMQNATSLNGVIVQWSIFALAIFIWIYYKPNIDENNQKIIVNGSLLFMIASILGLSNIQISRLTFFFSPYLMALGANAIDFACRKDKMWKIIKAVIVALLVIYIYVWLHETAYANYRLPF